MWRADNNAFRLTRRVADNSGRVINARVRYAAYGISAVSEGEFLLALLISPHGRDVALLRNRQVINTTVGGGLKFFRLCEPMREMRNQR